MEAIRFEITSEDILVFSEFHVEHSPSVRRLRRRQRWLWATVYLLVALAGIVLAGIVLLKRIHVHSTTFIIILAISVTYFTLAVTWALLWPRYQRWWYRRYAHKMLMEGRNATALGTRELVADEACMNAVGPGFESKLNWDVVERVASNPTHVFIYISATQAIVIPRASVHEGNLERFIAFVKGRIVSSARPVSDTLDIMEKPTGTI